MREIAMKFHTIYSLEDAYYQKAVEFYNKQLDVDFLKTALSQNDPYRIIKQKMIMF